MKSRIRKLIQRVLAPDVRRVSTEDAIKCLQEAVAPALQLAAPGKFERVQAGANTVVIRWEAGEQGVLFARLWPWTRKNHPVLQHREAARTFNSAGLATPEILFADDSMSQTTKWGMEVLVERAAAGEPISKVRENRAEALAAVAKDLAKLHRQEGTAWDRPWIPGKAMANPAPLWMERIDRFRERVSAENCGLTAEEIRASLDRLQKGLRTQASRRPALVHGDLSQSHVFVDPGGNLSWIDLETVHYGAPEEDLACVTRWLTPEHFDAFIRAYEDSAGRRVEREALWTFVLLLYWERLNSRVQQRRRATEKKRGEGPGSGKLDHDRMVAEKAIREIQTYSAD